MTRLGAKSNNRDNLCFINLESSLQGYASTLFPDFFVVLKIGNKIKFFYKKNKISVFLYTSEKVKLYAIGDFAIDTREIDIIVRNSSRVKSNYQITDQSIEMNDNISSTLLKDNDISLSNIDFTIKDIKLN